MNNITLGARSPSAASSITATGAGRALTPLLRQPWLVCALVLLVALMSFYVHVLNGQVERARHLRDGFAQRTVGNKAPAQQLADASPLPALSPVGPDTVR